MALASSSSSTLGLARSHTVAFSGIDVKDVDVQVQISAGLPAFMSKVQVSPENSRILLPM